jgi:hypothetical protein
MVNFVEFDLFVSFSSWLLIFLFSIHWKFFYCRNHVLVQVFVLLSPSLPLSFLLFAFVFFHASLHWLIFRTVLGGSGDNEHCHLLPDHIGKAFLFICCPKPEWNFIV